MIEIDAFHWNLARFFYGATCAWSAVGIVCNSAILWTTINTKTLRSTYNVLIAICAVGDIFDQAGTFIQFRFLFKVFYEVDSDICALLMVFIFLKYTDDDYRFEYLPIIGISLGCTCILCVGVDRMLSVLLALWYRKINTMLYHMLVLIFRVAVSPQVLATIIGGFCAYATVLMIVFRRTSRVVCEVWAPFPGSGILWFTGAVWVVNMASAAVYLVTWMSLQWHADSAAMKRVVKSLLIVGKVEIGGWISTPALFLLLQQQCFAWKYATPIFAHIAIAGKLFIYYSTSSEYRSAIIAIFLKRKSSQRKITSQPFVPVKM
uniref:G protein-coupled receptor n=1 Tax=Pristionchus pacificus TaxID=54126 RepID=A0A8R1Z312_PRIPA